MIVSDEDASIPHQHRLSVILLHMIVIVKSDTSGLSYHRGETTNRLAMVSGVRTFHRDGKFSRTLVVGGGCMPSPFHSIYNHKQSCGVRSK